MLFKIGMVLAAVPVTAMALVAGTGVVVVDVKDSGPEAHHFVVPIPLLLGETAAAFVPAKARHVDIGEARRYLPVAEQALKLLSESEDGELVKVDERDQHVLVAKKGTNIEIHVANRGESQQVDVVVPIAMALGVVREARDGDLSPAAVIGMLRKARLTTLADVRDGDQHVRVTVF